jgi:hypothetical protein
MWRCPAGAAAGSFTTSAGHIVGVCTQHVNSERILVEARDQAEAGSYLNAMLDQARPLHASNCLQLASCPACHVIHRHRRLTCL